MDRTISQKRLIAPKMVSKKRPFSRITQEKGRSQALFSSEKLRSAVLSEVLNGTNHLRGVGVLVVVPGHDLNLIGVVVATLNFSRFFVVVHNLETTVTVPQHTVVVPKPACPYQNYTTFHRHFQGFSHFFVLALFYTFYFFLRAYNFHVVSRTPRSVRDPGLPPGRSPCPDALLRVGDDDWSACALVAALMDGIE